jgi:hypothetical protein
MIPHIARANGRRWDDQAGRPTKFMQRLAVVLAMAIITACIAVVVVLSGGSH